MEIFWTNIRKTYIYNYDNIASIEKKIVGNVWEYHDLSNLDLDHVGNYLL